MEEIAEVPSRNLSKLVDRVLLSKQLHPHDGEDEDDDGQNEAEVAECTHRTTDDSDQQVQRRPRLGQLKYTQLQEIHGEIVIVRYLSSGAI